MVALALLGGCVRLVPDVAGPATVRPVPTRPVSPAPTTPAVKSPTAALAGLSRGPMAAGLGFDRDNAVAALRSFITSCPRLTKRADNSGLTRPEDWASACTAAKGWPDAQAAQFFATHFETAEVAGGNAFVTGYFEPEIAGVRTRQAGYDVPIYAQPSDLVRARPGDAPPLPDGRMPLGRYDDAGVFTAYYDRAQIDAGVLSGKGLEIGWAADPVEVFFLQIQGSGRLRAPDGSVIRIGFAGQNGHAYAGIWNRELNESPLKTHTREQARLLGAAMADRHGEKVVVEWGMRYGNPSTASALEKLTAAGCERILLFPLYPHYSATTTGTACDEAFRTLMKMRRQPAVRTAPTYHDDPDYIAALANSVRTHLAGLDWTPDLLITSFHGLPKSYLEKGDPYHCYCLKTARLLREALGMPPDKLRHAFQSRFGRTEWLQPYLEPMIKALPGQGVKNIAIMAPAFVSDCVETLEEVNQGIRETFLTAGGQNFTYIPCLNSSADHIHLLVKLTERETAGWL